MTLSGSTMTGSALETATDWFGWLIDRHFPAVALALLLIILLVFEARRPPE